MRTLEEILADAETYRSDGGIIRAAKEAHALGRSEGYAEGVEAAAKEVVGDCDLGEECFCAETAARIRALAPPPPAPRTEEDAPRYASRAQERRAKHLLETLGGAPPSPEAQQSNLDANLAALDAPRCEACRAIGGTGLCPKHGGTGRSTTGGGR